MFETEHLAGPSEAALDLVHDEHCIMPVAPAAQALGILNRHEVRPDSLVALCNHSGHGIGADLVDLRIAHCSAEAGHRALLAELGARPILDLDMRLGEASGAALAVAVLRAALACHHGMATFEEAGVDERA
jgi:hypothetical protein